MINPDQLDHLPAKKQRELARVVKLIFDEFEDAQKTKLSEKATSGRILKLILFGSYSRGDWVEDRVSGYRSDFDLLAVVNSEAFAETNEVWLTIDEHLTREYAVTRHLETPAKVIAHSLADVNDKLGRGLPFFIDIAATGLCSMKRPVIR